MFKGVKELVKKGGQTTSHDFELKIQNKTNFDIEIIKLEFKFATSAKTKIDQLPEFASINTESASGFILFGKSYLDFFYEERYLENICRIVEFPNYSSVDKLEWQKTAKSITVPKKAGILKQLHTELRSKTFRAEQVKEKKNAVNESLNNFIKDRLEFMRQNLLTISTIFNTKQTDKYFCIFSSGHFSMDTIPLIDITDIQHIDGEHSFTFITTNKYNINCDMSWGNGGAGNQNPRVLFKLVEKKGTAESSRKAETKEQSEEVVDDEYIMDEEFAADDKTSQELIINIQGEEDTKKEVVTDSLVYQNITRLRRGKTLPVLTPGGKKKSKRTIFKRRPKKTMKKSQSTHK